MEAKKIIITGAATRIGAAIAKSLANFNIKILLHYNKSSVEVKKLKISLEELGAEVFLIKADLNKTNELTNYSLTPFLNLDLVWNQGIAFGLFSFNQNIYYNALTLIIVIVTLIV